MTLVGVQAVAIALLAATTPHHEVATPLHEVTKIHEAHEGVLYKEVFRDLRGPSCLRDIALPVQSAAPLRTIDQGARSQITSSREVVVRTAAEWDSLWREHQPAGQHAAIDFSKEMIVGVFLGSRPTAGYSVTIVSASEDAGVLRVRYRETPPLTDAITAQVITFPYQLVALPKSAAKDVKFEKIE